MENKNILYEETQIFWLAIIPISAALVFVTSAYIYQLGANLISVPLFLSQIALLAAVPMAFYKMTVTVDSSHITVSFGIGMIKKKIALADIDRNGIQKAKIPRHWFYGVGIQLLGNGTVVYNTKPGPGIELPLASKTYIIGTKNYAEMIRAMG